MALSLDRSIRYALLIIITMKVFENEYSECRTRWKFTHCNSYCTMSLYINACTCLQSKFTFCPHSHSIYSCEVAGQVYSRGTLRIKKMKLAFQAAVVLFVTLSTFSLLNARPYTGI